MIGAALALVAATAAAEPRTLTEVVYDYGVTSYCGLLSPQVDRGFRVELARIAARDGLDEPEARRQRVAGWAAAEAEWRNRGLGGFRAWCEGEGVDAARHFLAIARGEG